MLQRLKKHWQELKDEPPGKRFEQRYRRIHVSGGRGGLRKVLVIAGGLLVIAIGVFFLPAPGPGSVVIVIGAGLLAQESLVAARALDWTEVQIRRVTSWGLRKWKAASLPVKIALVVTAAILTCAAGLGVYLVVSSR